MEGEFVVLHLVNPREKMWGKLLKLGSEGVLVKAISLDFFDEWVREIVRGSPTLGLSTVFFPMRRIERIDFDRDQVVGISYYQRFLNITGISIEEYIENSNR